MHMKSSIIKRKEILGLDLLRFLCALAVVVSHYLPRISDDYHLFHWGAAGVNVFFVISGFIISLSADGRSPFAFIQSRFTRLAPAAWVCATLTLAFLVLFDSGQTGLLRRYLASIFLIPVVPWPISSLDDIWIDGVYWTLFVEISFYFVILLLLVTNSFRFIKTLSTALGAVSLLYWAVFFATYFLYKDIPNHNAIIDSGFKRYLDLSLVHHGAWFGVGINIWLMTKAGIKDRWVSLSICLLGGALQACHHSIFIVKASPVPELLFSAFGIAVVFLSIARQSHAVSEKTQSICRWIGLTTYPLYLLHSQIGRIWVGLLTDLGLNKMSATLLVIPAIVLLAFTVAYYFEATIQRNTKPVFAWIAGLMATARLSAALLRPSIKFERNEAASLSPGTIAQAAANKGNA